MIDQPTPSLLEACEMLLRHVPDDAMEYSYGTHGERIYVADLARSAIAAAIAAASAQADLIPQSMHTPGPWHIGHNRDYNVDRYAGNAEWARVRGADGQLIAKIESVHPAGQRQSKDFDIERDNAFLIAAAPELLAASQAALARLLDPYLGEDDGERQNEEIDMLAAAIAKATGTVTVE